MNREIKLCLVYRDMWQSAGKFVPRVSMLNQVAEPIIDMGCWSRVETNGGGFEEINLLFGENPNLAVREWTTPFNKAGIQTQMLERGLNGIRMRPVAADVRQLMFKVKKLQGTDIARSFDGLNNPQNLALSFQYAKEGNMISQGAISLTYSPLHTVDYYIDLAEQYIDLGTEEICVKDMAGVGRPVSIGKIISGIKKRHPKTVIQYHAHSTPGFSVASALEAARAGADILDAGMEPLSWGTGHADLLTLHAMLIDAGFKLPDIKLKAYMDVRRLNQLFLDDYLGKFINPLNRKMNSLLIGPGLPGGMMGSLMADLEHNLNNINKWLEKKDKPKISQDNLLRKLFNEVQYVWPKLGYPCLVTPFSQYVKNVALMNVIQQLKGKERWSMIDENTWDMILGKSGKLMQPVDEVLQKLAATQQRTFYEGNPQDLYPDELDVYRKKMESLDWDTGQDDEELMTYAMHPTQYENYKSGQAALDFERLLQEKQIHSTGMIRPKPQPKSLTIEVNDQKYRVKISYDDTSNGTQKKKSKSPQLLNASSINGKRSTSGVFILAPLEGKFYLTRESHQKALSIGDQVEKGQTIGYIESMKVLNAISADKAGKVEEIIPNIGDNIEEDDPIVKLSV